MGYISKPWGLAVLAWAGFILFTSTNLAQQWAERAFAFFTGQMSASHPVHGWPYLLADKGFHLAIFCIFGLLLSRALLPGPPRFLTVILAGAFLGSCSEYLQSFFPGRDPAIHDVFINIVGTALGVLLYSSFTLKRSGVPGASTNLRAPVHISRDGR